MGLSSPTPQQLLSEAIIFWTIAVVLVAGRLCARVIVHGSIKRLQVDDYVMIVTFCFYTTLFVLIQISARYATNLLDPADTSNVLADLKQVKDRIFGSKIVIGLEQCMLASTWGVKICLLLLYHQMT
ncbi:MAG: hypothetical protein M1835_006799 [Candelina submexicana]|nr:MAG: hypothetical protein M1835_006799 [Candelina submexicana]